MQIRFAILLLLLSLGLVGCNDQSALDMQNRKWICQDRYSMYKTDEAGIFSYSLHKKNKYLSIYLQREYNKNNRIYPSINSMDDDWTIFNTGFKMMDKHSYKVTRKTSTKILGQEPLFFSTTLTCYRNTIKDLE